jgi:hypothetical protein
MGIFSALIVTQESGLGTINKAVRATLIDGEEIELGFKLIRDTLYLPPNV